MNEYMDDAEVVESSSSRAGLLFLAGIIGFFAFLAIIVPIIKADGGSTDSLFFAVIGAVAGAILLPVLLNAILSKLHLKGKSRRQVIEALVGYTPMYADGDETMMLPSNIVESFYEGVEQGRALVPYEGEYDEEYDDDEYKEDTAIIEANPMQFAPDFQPNIDTFLSRKVTLIGITGSGKSNAVAVICEEVAPYGTPLCLADTKDEYSAMAEPRYMPRGILAGSADVLRANPGLKNFIAVGVEGAYQFGWTIMEEGLQVVLNIKSYTFDDAARVMVGMMQGMNAWADARPNDKRVSSLFVIEEAHRWLPQRSDESQLSPEVLKLLQFTVFDTMVRVGRSNGLGLLLATQKSKDLDKRGLQSEWRLLFRQTESLDIAYYKSLGLDGSDIATLRTGECYVFSPSLQGWPIMMRQSYSPHGAHTPGLASVLAHRQTLRPLSALTTRSFAASPATTTLDPDTGDLPTPVIPEQQAMFTVSTAPAPKQINLQAYADAWNGGANSVRKLKAATAIETYYEANRIYRLLVESRMIEVKR